MDPGLVSVITYTTIPIFAFSVFGNCLVIVVIQRNKKLRNSPNTFILLSLAYADFWFSLLTFVDIIILSNQASYIYFEFFFNALASIYIYVALAVERYYAILQPLVHIARTKRSLLWKVWFLIYILAAVFSAPGYYIGFKRRQLENSLRNTTANVTITASIWFETLGAIYSFALFVFGLVLPSAAIIFLYSRVIYHVWFKATKNRTINAGLLKSRHKLTKLFVLVTVVFIITWSPTFARLLVTQYGVRNQETIKFELYSMLLGMVGSTANPMIYSFRCPRFRQEIGTLFNFRCRERGVKNLKLCAIKNAANGYFLTKKRPRRKKTSEPVVMIAMRPFNHWQKINFWPTNELGNGSQFKKLGMYSSFGSDPTGL